MKDNQDPINFTRIPNEVLEALARIRIPGRSRQILDVVIRKTFGWNKQEEEISFKQFRQDTGIKDDANIFRSIKTLKAMGILLVKNDKSKYPSYSIQWDYTKWIHLSKMTSKPKTVKSGDHLSKMTSKHLPKMTSNHLSKMTSPLKIKEKEKEKEKERAKHTTFTIQKLKEFKQQKDKELAEFQQSQTGKIPQGKLADLTAEKIKAINKEIENYERELLGVDSGIPAAKKEKKAKPFGPVPQKEPAPFSPRYVKRQISLKKRELKDPALSTDRQNRIRAELKGWEMQLSGPQRDN